MRTSDTRQRILNFMRTFIKEKGYAPSIGEIQKTLGLSSSSLVGYHLKALEEEGTIHRTPERARAMEVAGVGKRARLVPLLGIIAAGEPINVPPTGVRDIEELDMVEVPADMVPQNIDAFALQVKGHSMIDALVGNGDIVILEAVNTAENGQMVAVWLSDRDEVTLKKLYQERDGRIRLQPANPLMKPRYVDPENVVVQGRVIAVLRKVPRPYKVMAGGRHAG